MKQSFIVLVFLFWGLPVTIAQNKVVDSLKNLVANTNADSTKVLLMIDLAANYQFYNSDSALAVIEDATKLAQSTDYKRGELRAICRKGEILHLRGALPQALEAELTGIQLSQKYGYRDIEAECLTFLATIYLDLAEYRMAYHYLFRAKKIYDNIDIKLLFGSAQQIPPYTLSNIGYAYEKLNMLDSAMYYYKAVFSYPINYESQQRTDVLTRIGIVAMRKHNYTDALKQFKEALSITQISNDLLNRSICLSQIALIFKEQNNVDSALYYALLAYESGEKSSYKTAVLEAGILLASFYKQKGNLDSAFYYQQMAMNIKDSLFGLDKFQKIQLLALSEEQRVQQIKEEQVLYKTRMLQISILFFVAVALFIVFILWRSNRQQKKANHSLNEKNVEIERQSENLRKTLFELKSTQSQLIQSEKMASLGELTAGIAHEIQNPLNFVNNFSEVNKELLIEMKDEMDKGNIADANEIANDIIANEEKINHHGKRADAIVKGMLQHSRSSSGVKEPTNINALADEYLRLAYHGLRAKDKLFNATMITDFDEGIGNINIIPQDIGRVILNLITNAFYAAPLPPEEGFSDPDYVHNPTVWVSTKKEGNKVLISVRDNGPGIQQKILDKIFQPFFTTKPTGQGTGLGLSLAYDIVKAHSGELKVETNEGKGTTFSFYLFVTNDL